MKLSNSLFLQSLSGVKFQNIDFNQKGRSLFEIVSNQRMSSQMNSSNISEVQNQSARLNEPQQNQQQPQSIFDRIRGVQLFKLSRKNILKGIFLLIIIGATFWMASSLLHETLIRDRTPFNFGKSSKDVQQIAAPDDIGYRSFYYFNLMVKIAKQNVQNKKSFSNDDLPQQQFSDISFWELYGLFKVVKAIQLANGYDDMSKPSDDTKNATDDKKYDLLDNLTAPVNLTSLFCKIADQSACSSCYSFPITASIEYQITKTTGKKIKLSEQELIDCSNPDPNANGCESGNMTKGFEYARDIGLVPQKNYPYRSQTGTSYECNKKILDDGNVTKYKISTFRSLPLGNCKAIQYELVMGNAVASMINIGQIGLIKDYNQRNFCVIEAFRDCLKTSPNHAVTIVGQTENQDWIVRNSWGQSWGNNGYFIIKKGNTCGICNHAVVPQL